MNENIEKIIGIIVEEVIKELEKLGVEIEVSGKCANKAVKQFSSEKNSMMKIEINGYKTPVLTEERLEAVGDNINEIVVPSGTMLTPGAREIIRKRKLIVSEN